MCFIGNAGDKARQVKALHEERVLVRVDSDGVNPPERVTNDVGRMEIAFLFIVNGTSKMSRNRYFRPIDFLIASALSHHQMSEPD